MTAMVLCKTCGWGWPGSCPHACGHDHACQGPFAQGIDDGSVVWGLEMAIIDAGDEDDDA